MNTPPKDWLDEKRVDGALSVKSGSIDVEKRTLRATVTSDIVDRDNDVILPNAFKGRIETFKKNPILLWNHNPFDTPIGKATDLSFHDHGIDATLFFRKGNERAEDVFDAYQDGTLTSFSVGFRTFNREPGVREGKNVSLITDAELFEISAVTLPANTDAIAKADRRAQMLKSALFGEGSEKTLYGAPTNLDVWKRCLAMAQRQIEDGRENKNFPDAERATAEQLHLALKALLASPASDEEAKVAEELNACLSLIRKAS